MDKYDLLEAMGGIRDRYIEDAGLPSATEREPAAAGPSASSQGNKTLHKKTAVKKVRRLHRWSTVVAALVCVSIILPNLMPGFSSVFRDVPLLNRYFSLVTFRKPPAKEMAAGSRSADSGVFTMGSENTKAVSEEEAACETEEEYDGSESYSMSPGTNGNSPSENQESSKENAAGSADSQAYDQSLSMADSPDLSDTADEYAPYSEGTLSLQAVLSEADLSEDVRARAQTQIMDFEKYVSDETGYDSLSFVHELAAETEDLLSISVTSCTEEDDNYLQTNHFVIDKSTGEKLALHSLFGRDVDYVTPISENIKEQMRIEMQQDPYMQYNLDSAENPETDFKSIRRDQDYYINEDGNLVICFDVEEVAPLYMGAAEFTIPQEITDTLLSE